MIVDDEGGLTKAEADVAFGDLRLHIDVVEPGAHNRNPVERHHQILRRLFERGYNNPENSTLMDDGKLSIQDIVNSSCIAKNSLLFYGGYNSYQW